MLGRVKWSLGQVLRPEHFESLAEDLATEARTLGRLASGPPPTGFAALTWSESALQNEGLLRLQSLATLFPSGELAVRGENAEVEGFTFNLNDRDETAVRLFLFRLRQTTAVSKSVEHIWHRLVISAEEDLPGTAERMFLGEFRQDAEGRWLPQLCSMPSMLSTVHSSHLQELLHRVRARIEQLQVRLSQEVAVEYLGGAQQMSVRNCLSAVLRAVGLLNDLQAGVDVPPHVLFSELRALFIACYLHQGSWQETTPEMATAPYLHQTPGPGFEKLVLGLENLTGRDWTRLIHAHFEQREGWYVLDELPAEAKQVEQIYLVLRKRDPQAPVDIAKLRMGCASRMPVLHRLALRGVGLRSIEAPGFVVNLDRGSELYLVEDSEEWTVALREGNVAFRWDDRNIIGASLCWRSPSASSQAS
ncbi:MAG: type VI secretion system baseplate subunit TssK [Myxococcota bacterium]